jgi:hypothetical protein
VEENTVKALSLLQDELKDIAKTVDQHTLILKEHESMIKQMA